MRHFKLLLAALFAAMTLMLAAAPSFAVDVDAEPIWNNDDAQAKCTNVCGGRQNWDGNWRTVVSGSNSVCSCRAAAAFPSGPAMSRAGGGSTCSVPASGACFSCAAYCYEGLRAQCVASRPQASLCAAPANCSCR